MEVFAKERGSVVSQEAHQYWWMIFSGIINEVPLSLPLTCHGVPAPSTMIRTSIQS
jgi:hypothetical protein